MSRGARNDCAVGGGEKHPRVNWDEGWSRRGPGPLWTDHAAWKAPRVAVQHREAEAKSLGRVDRARLDVKSVGLADAFEQCSFGGRHPHLAASFEAGEECGPARRVKVPRDFVEEQDRGLAAAFGDQLGMGED